MKSIVLISVFFGEFPYYFPLFRESANYNKDINWIIFTNQKCKNLNATYAPKIFGTHDNIKIIPFELIEFNNLASQKMDLKADLSSSYKLCDFKPAYGKIFEDYIRGYDFWGHVDIDVIWGDMRKFLNEEALSHDVVTGDQRYISGVFTIYKNTEELKKIYSSFHDEYDRLIHTDKYETLDEVPIDFVLKRNPNLKIFSGFDCSGKRLPIVRYGKKRTPARWRDGKLTIESYLKDYPGQGKFCGFGAETMLFHLREAVSRHYVDLDTKMIHAVPEQAMYSMVAAKVKSMDRNK